MSRFAQYYGKYKHDAGCYDWEQRQQHLGALFDKDKFIEAIREGKIYVDFDARTGHNHGTKFRIRYNGIPSLYKNAEVVLDERDK